MRVSKPAVGRLIRQSRRYSGLGFHESHGSEARPEVGVLDVPAQLDRLQQRLHVSVIKDTIDRETPTDRPIAFSTSRHAQQGRTGTSGSPVTPSED
jgi:hypothetical protein